MLLDKFTEYFSRFIENIQKQYNCYIFYTKINFFHPIIYILYICDIVSANSNEPSVDLRRDLTSPFTKLRKRYYKERKIEPVTFSKENVKRRKFLARASTED